MSNRLKILKMYLFRSFDYILWAVIYGIITSWYWFISESIVSAYLWHIVGISISLIIDKIRVNRIYKKLENPPTDEKSRLKLAKKDLGSIKTSLYLFYIFALIFSQILSMEPNINVSQDIKGYFKSVEYAILVLFALDIFFSNIISDDKRIRKFKDEFKN